MVCDDVALKNSNSSGTKVVFAPYDTSFDVNLEVYLEDDLDKVSQITFLDALVLTSRRFIESLSSIHDIHYDDIHFHRFSDELGEVTIAPAAPTSILNMIRAGFRLQWKGKRRVKIPDSSRSSHIEEGHGEHVVREESQQCAKALEGEEAKILVKDAVRMFCARYNKSTADDFKNNDIPIPEYNTDGRGKTVKEKMVKEVCDLKIEREVQRIASACRTQGLYLDLKKLIIPSRGALRTSDRPEHQKEWYNSVGRHFEHAYASRKEGWNMLPPKKQVEELESTMVRLIPGWHDGHDFPRLRQIHPKNEEIQRLVSAQASAPEVHRYSEMLGNEIITSIKCSCLQNLEDERTKNAQNELHLRIQNDNLHAELKKQDSMQERGSELAQRGEMHRKALEIQNREQKKEITRLRNELKKRVEPKRQRTVYSKENGPTNSRVEQTFVPQSIVTKSGRQIKLSRRAMGIEED
jgi:hypothetical protein